MKKAAIITLFGNYNYGNKLQNYAVQSILESYGFDARTIIVRKDPFREPVKSLIQRIKALRGDPQALRHVRLAKFTGKNIKHRYYYSLNGLIRRGLARSFDCFVSGSDQVWNPEIHGRLLANYLLAFADGRQRICLAPSIGTDRIEPVYEQVMKKELAGFAQLSCREIQGAELISSLTGRECERILDPTLALDADFWRSFADGSVKKGGEHIFCYFLGEAEDIRSRIAVFAKERGYTVIDPSCVTGGCYGIDPREFVGYIDSARLVFTDSYHVTAFSVNLETPFYVYDRSSDRADISNTRMGSRIATLTELFDLTDRHVGRDFGDYDTDCEFSYARRVLKQERAAFREYTDRAFRIFE